MESPPSFSTNSEVPPLSEDSGLLLTSGSFSSDSASGWHHIGSELQESDYDEKSLSLCESTDASGHMCGDNFNTVKKGPGKITVTTIEPPPQFQDSPIQTSPIPITITKSSSVEVPRGTDDTYEIILNARSATLNVPMSGRHLLPIYGRKLKCGLGVGVGVGVGVGGHRFASPRLLHLSPCRARPASRASLSSRRSSSHNSLVTQLPGDADDSSYITQAISHDTLSAHAPDHPISDMYTVPFDSDIYAVPIDMVRPSLNHLRAKGKKQRVFKKRKSNSYTLTVNAPVDRNKAKENFRYKEAKNKRHSLQSTSTRKSESDTDSLHMTLREMRKYLHTLYSSSSDSETKNTINKRNNGITIKPDLHPKQTAKDNGKVFLKETTEITNKIVETNNNKKVKNSFGLNTKSRKHKEIISKDLESDKLEKSLKKSGTGPSHKSKISPVRILSINLKQSFCNLFRWRRQSVSDSSEACVPVGGEGDGVPAAVRRALPPLPAPPGAPAAAPAPAAPASRQPQEEETVASVFATSIQKVKDYGWYWGPISVETAEKILSNEPDGSFIVRDSSDDHYIFTLTFKLNGLRHVRIEHDQGFCFAGCAMFKAQTIVEFIENAVETSRSGRYLFFLNLRPVLGPVRVQLLFPVSRFKRVQSLQHMCRFVILKYVRRDLIGSLPLPRRIVDYLSATHYYAEMLAEI